MIKKIFVFAILFGFYYNLLVAQTAQDRCKQAKALIKVVNQYHFSPKEIDQRFASTVIRTVLQKLDPRALYFTKDDTLKIQLEQQKLKDYVQNSSCDFIYIITDIFKDRLNVADSLISQIMSNQFNLIVNDSLPFDEYKNLHFAENSIALKAKWEKWLKFQTLRQLFNQAQYDSLVFKENTMVLQSRVPEAMVKVKIREKKIIQKIKNKPVGFENYICGTVLNSIAQFFDPHTEYFSKTDKTNFENLLSKETDSFGFSIDETKSGELIIDRIKPGGPAWKSKKIEKGDFLLEAVAKGQPTIDFLNTDLYEAIDYLFLSEIKSIELKIKHTNGNIEEVHLSKEKTAYENNQINSYIIKGKKCIGYIALPDFYIGDEIKSLGCSNDVAKEILKLQKDKIDGLIIDIRFNGGGDLNEANQLAGLFIDEGPLNITSDRFSKPRLIKDIFRGTIYDGPILLMVNGQSASASEVLAGTLQDYNRAVIFGSQTFGKATAQVILPLELVTNPLSKVSNPNLDMGFIKLTVNKIYRITGASHQRKGITPDIQITFPYDKISEREENYAMAMINDSIDKKVVFKKNPPLPLEYLRNKSASRIKTNNLFLKISKLKNESVNNSFLVKGISLQINHFKNSLSKVNETINQINKLPEKVSDEYTIDCNYLNNELIVNDSYLSDIVTEDKKRIQKDIYIEEAYNIIMDLVELENNKTSGK